MWHGNLFIWTCMTACKRSGKHRARWKRKTSGRWQTEVSVWSMSALCTITCMHAFRKRTEKRRKTESGRKNSLICFWYTEQMQWGETKPFPGCWLQQYCGSEVKHTGWFVRPRFWAVFIGTGPCLHFCLWYENSFRCMVYSTAPLTF